MLCMPVVKHSVMGRITRGDGLSLDPAAGRWLLARCRFCGEQGCCVCGRVLVSKAGAKRSTRSFSGSIKYAIFNARDAARVESPGPARGRRS